ncbi:DUF6284 family protein [Streptomyces sp. NPDC001941]|uniref:DUF6284 family protein n=1 Tax=Streptomyces sp. NPDC001941 TaxID=3154659 RepID=UPI00331A09D1
MKLIAALQSTVTNRLPDIEPSAFELDAIDREMPVILAELDLLDAEIIALDRVPNEVDDQRLRRATRRVLAAYAAVANQSVPVTEVGV